MLSGSTILRVLLVLVAAAGIAGIVQFVWTRSGTPGSAVSTDVPPPVAPAPRSEASRPVPPPEPAEPAPVAPAPPASAEAPPAPVTPLPRREPAPVAPAAPATLPSPPTAAPDPAEVAAENAPPPAVALIDLNTATLAELNGLKGGGAIGRAIIGHRPYASVDQLLSKRVLNRATYQRIKDQVTVR